MAYPMIRGRISGPSTRKRLILALVAAASLLAVRAGQAAGARTPNRATLPGLAGVWQDPASPDFFLEVAGVQILIASSGRIREAATVLEPADEGLLVCQVGYEVQLPIRRVDDHVELFDAREGKTRRLVKLDSKPAALSLSLPLPDPVPLPEERILVIQGEIGRRYQADQALLRQRVRGQEEPPSWLADSAKNLPPDRPSEGINFRAIDLYGTNTEFMRNLVQEIGWVDAHRFGYPASLNAFFLVQHSRDLPLMLTVLPRIKEDVDAGLMDGSSYALLYDRSQLALGRPQRFGSQVAKSPSGEWFVLPLEEPEGVDARRQQWGLQPLKDYVGVFGATEVKLSTECSVLTSVEPQAPGGR